MEVEEVEEVLEDVYYLASKAAQVAVGLVREALAEYQQRNFNGGSCWTCCPASRGRWAGAGTGGLSTGPRTFWTRLLFLHQIHPPTPGRTPMVVSPGVRHLPELLSEAEILYYLSS